MKEEIQEYVKDLYALRMENKKYFEEIEKKNSQF